jgi:hypothetical protein
MSRVRSSHIPHQRGFPVVSMSSYGQSASKWPLAPQPWHFMLALLNFRSCLLQLLLNPTFIFSIYGQKLAPVGS